MESSGSSGEYINQHKNFFFPFLIMSCSKACMETPFGHECGGEGQRGRKKRLQRQLVL